MTNNRDYTMGVIGVGNIASHFIKGMRLKDDNRQVFLYPQNATKAAVLANDYDCKIISDRSQLVKNSDIVLLCVRPCQVESALSGIDFPYGKILLSAVGSVSIADMRQIVGPNPEIVRIMPVISIEVATGSIPMFPNHEVIKQMLSRLGTVFAVSDENHLTPATAATCVHGWFYRIFDILTEKLVSAGLPQELAKSMIMENASGAAKYGLAKIQLSLDEISASVAKPGTYTHAGLAELENGRFHELLDNAVDLTLKKLNSSNVDIALSTEESR